MAQIRMKSILAGPAFSADPGQIVDCDEALAVALVAGGYAARLDAPPKRPPQVAAPAPVEAAVVPAAPETTMLAPPVAVMPPARGRKRG